jgi:hypothetical protein
MNSIRGSEQFANTYPGESASPRWGNERNYVWMSKDRRTGTLFWAKKSIIV